jgi:cellulose synthase/poly-beta-1,6-N-acetylglucosamine synthase-like glycosyltransferase
MTELAAFALLLAALALLVPAVVLAIEVAAAALLPRRDAFTRAGPRPRVDVLVPAHDEAAQIEATVAALARQLAPGDRVIVIADNCRDETAALALRAGACVLERRDPERFGKGYALAAGVAFAQTDPPSVALIVDADTWPGDGLVATLASLAHASGRPVQAAYTLELPREVWLGARLSAFAFRLRNQVRPRGQARLGLPCPLLGSGMAIPWEQLRAASLAHGRTAEDLALGAELALAGAPPLFCEGASVVGRLPARSSDAHAQRRRWQHGHLAVALAQAPELLRASLARRDPALATLALDLAVPPLSLLALVWLALFVPAAACALLGAGSAALGVLALAAALTLGAVALAWHRFARDLLPPAAWREAPAYWLAQLPSHLGFLRRRDDRWLADERRR